MNYQDIIKNDVERKIQLSYCCAPVYIRYPQESSHQWRTSNLAQTILVPDRKTWYSIHIKQVPDF